MPRLAVGAAGSRPCAKGRSLPHKLCCVGLTPDLRLCSTGQCVYSFTSRCQFLRTKLKVCKGETGMGEKLVRLPFENYSCPCRPISVN